MKTLLKNATLLPECGYEGQKCNLLIDNGIIQKITVQEITDAVHETVDCAGNLLMPDGSQRNMRMNSYDLFDREYGDFIVYELIPYVSESMRLRSPTRPTCTSFREDPPEEFPHFALHGFIPIISEEFI